MIAAGKRHEQISKIATTGIAQFSDVLETGERTARAVSNEEFALGHGAAVKRTGDFFHQLVNFVVTQFETLFGS
jgi:hypothetical protein